MIRLPPFTYRAPGTAKEASAILRDEGPEAMLLAGGTDLLPNMKRRQQMPKTLVALRKVDGWARREATPATLVLGAGLVLEELVADRGLKAALPALWRAAAQVATPLIRNQATLGGNLCLDTRCNYYNQSQEWRQAIDFCMKAPAKAGGSYQAGAFAGAMPVEAGAREAELRSAPEVTGRLPVARDGNEAGSICWVAPGSPRCWAVSSSDTAPALLALGAEVRLVSHAGERRIPLAALYDFAGADGMTYLAKRHDEVLTLVSVPVVEARRSTYWKLRRRGSFDFPVASVAAMVRLGAGGGVDEACIVLGAVTSRPLVCEQAAAMLIGRTMDDAAIEAAASEAAKLAKPLDNTDYKLGFRKEVVEALVAGALRELRGDDPETLGVLARHARRAIPVPASEGW